MSRVIWKRSRRPSNLAAMRWLLILFALALATPAFAQRWPDAEANRYWPLKEERVRAYREHDRAAFERILASDFTTLAPDGRRLTRQQYLDAEFGAESHAGVSVDTEVTSFSAHRTGSTLVLSYEEIERSQVGDNQFVEHLARLDVYVRQGGRWRLLTMTATRIPQAPPTIEVSGAALAQYVGVYRFAPDIVSTVRMDGAHLMEQTTGNAEGELLPIAPDVFYAPPDVQARVSFERDTAGRVVAQVYRSGDQVFRAPRE